MQKLSMQQSKYLHLVRILCALQYQMTYWQAPVDYFHKSFTIKITVFSNFSKLRSKQDPVSDTYHLLRLAETN